MASKSKKSSAANRASSRPIHPAYVPSFAPLGAELSVWAYLTVPRPAVSAAGGSELQQQHKQQPQQPPVLPNLVTAHSTTLRIYSLDPSTGRLLLASTYDDLAGSIVTLDVISGGAGANSSDRSGAAAAAAAATASGGPTYDALLLGFAGEPRLSVVYPPTVLQGSGDDSSSTGGGSDSWSGVLTASSIVDLTPALLDACRGGREPLDIDLQCCVGGSGTPGGISISSGEGVRSGGSSSDLNAAASAVTTTAAVILGGGAAVAAFDLTRTPRPHSPSPQNRSKDSTSESSGWWRTATEPYLLPLPTLAAAALNPEPLSSSGGGGGGGGRGGKNRRYASANSAINPNGPKISHGFGDILDCQYLRGYTEPVLLLLHSNPNRLGGRAWSGRLATPSSGGGTCHPLSLTAISISVPQRRSVVLWTLKDVLPSDTFKLVSHPTDGVLCLGVNEIVYVDGGGRIRCGVAGNGFARATCPAGLVPPMMDDDDVSPAGTSKAGGSASVVLKSVITANPSPLPLLALALDGCRVSFVSDDVAALCLRCGAVYSLEIHRAADYSAGSGRIAQSLSLSPMNCRLGGLGMISTLSALPLVTLGKGAGGGGGAFGDLAVKLGGTDDDQTKQDETRLGVLFAGSRLGDSTLLLYGMREKVTLIEPEVESSTASDEDEGTTGKEGSSGKRKRSASETEGEDNGKKREAVQHEDAPSAAAVTDDEEAHLMEEEEEALYHPPDQGDLESWSGGTADLIANDDGSRSKGDVLGPLSTNRRRRVVISSLSVFDSPAPLAIDSLTGVGPLGAGTIGPTSAAGAGGSGASSTSIHPCGWGSSGGLALLTVPGMNAPTSTSEVGDNPRGTMVTEADCRDISAVFGLSRTGLILLCKSEGGAVVMRMSSEADEAIKASSVIVKKEEGDETHAEDVSTKASSDNKVVEVELEKITGEGTSTSEAMDIDGQATAASILKSAEILQAHEWNPSESGNDDDQYIILFIKDNGKHSLVILLVSPSDGTGGDDSYDSVVSLSKIFEIHPPSDATGDDDVIRLKSVTPLTCVSAENGSSYPALGTVWSNGFGSLIAVKVTDKEDGFELIQSTLDGPTNKSQDVSAMQGDDDDDEVLSFYSSYAIVALDIFDGSCNLFKTALSGGTAAAADIGKASLGGQSVDKKNGRSDNFCDFDADDLELYGSAISLGAETNAASEPIEMGSSQESTRTIAPTRVNPLGGVIDRKGPKTTYLAIARQSGALEIHDLSKYDEFSDVTGSTSETSLVWRSYGCGIGTSVLVQNASKVRTPRTHTTRASEIRFFFAGPCAISSMASSEPNETTAAEKAATPTGDTIDVMRSLCLLVETDLGDIHLYVASERAMNIDFSRAPTGMVGRAGKDQARHTLKLRRRKIISSPTSDDALAYRPNRLHRFGAISGQSGLFAGTTRPFWVVSERGAPAVIQHRARHVAPAGGKEIPVASFCCDISISRGSGNDGFVTLHERIGQVGSQRLTVFDGLSDIFAPLGIFPGGGLCVQKIPLGVTVRKIVFIDDLAVSSVARPLYAALVSREVEAEQGALNDDGLTREERQRMKAEKDKERTARQVEADLGGFDVEQEWVEEIERDDYFKVDTSLGRAPPIPKKVFELWLVDAASGWNVIDSYELDEVEHGASMEVMSLSELVPETAASSSASQDDFDNDLFIIVGTGIIDKDGEDVSAKGRIRLFNVTRNTEEDVAKGEARAEMTFLYDKDIALGPVTSLSCLVSEGKHRLVVGAGAEITIEQWTGAKLLQVGFFHVNMQVQRISLFKTFFLLSDAYDSLHFLVWRESDKSLTLLAKDYEPVVLYATGLMSRGGAMSFVCHDDRENLRFLQYAPNDIAARGGNKLVCRADFHLGSQTTDLQSHFCRSSLLINSATPSSTLAALKQQDPLFGRIDDDQRFAVHFGSTDGALGSLVPLSEQAYWRLAALQSVMSNALDSNCALSYRAWRLFRRSARRGGCRNHDRMKGCLDGELLSKFVDLSIADQEDLASSVGSTVELIIENILDLKCAGMVI